MPLREEVATEAANLPKFIEKYLPLMQRIEVAAENAADISAGAETDTSVSFEITYLSDEFLAETDLETLLCEALEKAGCEYDMMDNGPEFFIVCETPADGRKAEKAIVSVLRKVLPPEDLEIVSVERSAANEPTRAVKLTKK